MIICDRSWKRDGQPVAASTTITISDREGEQIFNLCGAEKEALLSFICEPEEWGRKTPDPTSNVRGLMETVSKQFQREF